MDFGHISWIGPTSKNPTAVLSQEKEVIFEVLEEKEVGVIHLFIRSILLTVRPSDNKAPDVFKEVLDVATFDAFFLALTVVIAS